MPAENSDLREAAARLRGAVAEGCYDRAETILSDYLRLVQAAASPATLREAMDLLEWARRAVLAGRAQAAARFAQFRTRPRGYPRASRAGVHTWELEG